MFNQADKPQLFSCMGYFNLTKIAVKLYVVTTACAISCTGYILLGGLIGK